LSLAILMTLTLSLVNGDASYVSSSSLLLLLLLPAVSQEKSSSCSASKIYYPDAMNKLNIVINTGIVHCNYALPVCYSMLHKKSFIVNCLYRFV